VALRPGDAAAVRFTWLERPVDLDLDLDVILSRDADLLLDDEDEFDELLTAAAEGHEPFSEAATRSLARLAASTP
jgi:hypothetical protein